jgi:hypothetical protein
LLWPRQRIVLLCYRMSMLLLLLLRVRKPYAATLSSDTTNQKSTWILGSFPAHCLAIALNASSLHSFLLILRYCRLNLKCLCGRKSLCSVGSCISLLSRDRTSTIKLISVDQGSVLFKVLLLLLLLLHQEIRLISL